MSQTIKKKITAKRLPTDSKQSQQLITFVSSLGVNKSLELYSCNDQVYINADVILPVLSVDLAWFHKNADVITHYIILKSITYINRYGMTKLIGQSKQPSAFRLQDYLYELFYRVETEGTVNRDSIQSRKQLLEITDELETYRCIVAKNKDTITEAQEIASAALNDYNCIEQENAKLLKQIELNEVEINELSESVETYKSIANKLAKYVRIKSKTPPDEAFSDALDIEDDEDPSELSVVSDAIKAKAKLKAAIKTKLKDAIKPRENVVARDPNKFKTAASGNLIIYVMRSVEVYDDNFNYQWSITDITPSDAILYESEEFLAGTINYVQHTDICYRALTISEERRKCIMLFLELVNFITDEQTIEKLIQ